MPEVEATVVANERAWGQVWQMTLHAPVLAQHALGGHFIALRCGWGADPLLPRAYWISGRAAALGDISLLYAGEGAAAHWMRDRPVGSTLSAQGPHGTPFRRDPRSRHFLLLGQGSHVFPLLGMAAELAASGLAVTLGLADSSADDLPPSRMISPEVEYHPLTADGSSGRRGTLDDVLTQLAPWADQVLLSAPVTLALSLLQTVRRARLRVPPGFAQMLIQTPLPCTSGTCDGCLVVTRHGYRKACRTGPAFDLRDLAP